MSVNKVILVGRLGTDPEIRYTPSGKALCRLSVGTQRRRPPADNEGDPETSWHRVVVWERQAELCHTYLTKGRQVYLEGRLQTQSYERSDGTRAQATEVVAERVVFLGASHGTTAARSAQVTSGTTGTGVGRGASAGDALPF